MAANRPAMGGIGRGRGRSRPLNEMVNGNGPSGFASSTASQQQPAPYPDFSNQQSNGFGGTSNGFSGGGSGGGGSGSGGFGGGSGGGGSGGFGGGSGGFGGGGGSGGFGGGGFGGGGGSGGFQGGGGGFGGGGGGFVGGSTSGGGQRPGASGDGCRNCGEGGHYARECPNPQKCNKCGEPGHKAFECSRGNSGDGGDERKPVTYVPEAIADADIFGVQRYTAAADVHNRFGSAEVTCDSKEVKPINSFAEVLRGEMYHQVLQNVEKAGWTKPLPIQQYGIPALLRGPPNDLMGCAQTGSGKTVAFLLPIVLQMIDNGEDECIPNTEPQKPVAVIVAPTRELSSQTYNEMRKLSVGTKIKPVNVYGGVAVRYHISQVRAGCNVIIATMGRLWDLIGRNVISLEECHYIVLDEADHMLEQGFRGDIERLFQHEDLPPQENRQTAMFSATFSDNVQDIAKEFLTEHYTFVTVGKLGCTNSDVTQEVLEVRQDQKKDVLLEKLKQYEVEKTTQRNTKTIIFVERRRTCDFLADRVNNEKQPGIIALSMSSDLDQRMREQALRQFRKGEVNVLIATNVAARGLDIPEIDHVINYDLPGEKDTYVHRVGRTGRLGNRGYATSFFDPEQDMSYAPILVELLADVQAEVPEFLLARGSGFSTSSGFGASGGGGNEEMLGTQSNDQQGWE